MSNTQNWQSCLEFISQQVSQQDFRTWFEPMQFVSFQADELTLAVPSRFFAEYVDGHYPEMLKKALVTHFGEKVRLRYKLSTENAPLPETTAAPIHTGHPQQSVDQRRLPPLDPQLNVRYTFENFVEGVSNRLARSVGLSIANNPGKSSFNPFFLYGPSGVGKTHLVNAIGVKIRELTPEKRVLFVSAHVFKTQYTDSVIHNTSNDFIHFYQTVDVLIIDDIQEITTSKTQLAFFHIFNHLQQNNKQIIITCDRPPVLFEGIEERMLTRFKWGMVAELEKPDSQLRKDILLSKIRRDGLQFPEEVVKYIAENVESSVRELEGIINSIMASAGVDNCEIDPELTRRVVARAEKKKKKKLSADDIIAAVCGHYGVKAKDLNSKSRKRNVVAARQLAMFLSHKYTGASYNLLGRKFGGKDHTTVLYACNQVSRRISTDKNFRREVEDLESVLK